MKIGRRLIHYSFEPLKQLNSVPQTGKGVGVLKPNGLWVSAEGERDWLEWCIAENWGLERMQYATEIILADTANILHIKNAREFDFFEEEYVIAPNYPHENGLYRPEKIEWDRAALVYQGIVISPYIWERRLGRGALWYYGWDCASGCIWDAKAVKELRHLEWVPPQVTDDSLTSAPPS